MKFRYAVILACVIFFTSIGLGKERGDAAVHSPYDLSMTSFYVTFASPPEITNVAPSTGHTGTPVTINGQHFFGATNVNFNGTSGVISTNSDFQITTVVPAGATTGLITVTTPSGSGSSLNNFVVDNTPPAAPVLTGTNPPSPSNNGSPLIQGTSEPNSTVTIYASGFCSGPPAATVVADGLGNFSVPVSVPLNSTTTFTATATDTAGNGSFCSSSITYVRDNIAPNMPVLTGTAPASPSMNNTPIIQGTAEAHSVIKMYTTGSCSGPVAGTTITAVSGIFSVMVNVPSNSITTITATATDSAGNVSLCSAGLTYVHDTSPPAAPVLTGTSPGSPANNNSPHILGISEPGAQIAMYTDPSCVLPPVSTGVANGSGLFSIVVTVGDNTTTTFYAHATDAAGNVSGCTSSGITYIENSNLPPASICGAKYFDTNGNGIFEPGLGESGASGWEIWAINSLGDTLKTITDATGHYCFGNLTDTLYRVLENQQSGYIQTGGQPYYLLHMTSSTQIDTVDFGNALPGKINGNKFNDLNGNGTQQGNEPGLPGWTICLAPQQLQPNIDLTHGNVAVALNLNGVGNVDAHYDGYYAVKYGSLVNGQHIVPADLLSFHFAADSMNHVGHALDAPVDKLENYDYPGQYAERFDGIDKGGSQDSGFFYFNVKFVLDSIVTGGASKVVVTHQPLHIRGGMTTIPPSTNTTYHLAGPAVQLYDIQTGQPAGMLNSFTLTKTLPVLPASPICLLTDNTGNFSFTSVIPGKYTITELSQPCWSQITPNPSTITVPSGDSVGGIVFGNRQQSGRICVTKYFDENHNQLLDAGESPMGGITFNLTGTNPLNVFSGSTSGTGKLCFDNLPPDTYTLTEAIPPGYEVSVPKSGFSSFTITGCERDSVVWMNAAAYTDSSFRTATVQQWVLGIDQAGKHKSVKCKPDKVDFLFNLNYRFGLLRLKFPMLTSGVVRIGKNHPLLPPVANWSNSKDVTLDFTGLNASGQILEFTGHGLKGKPISFSYVWTTSTGSVIDKGSLPGKPSMIEDSLKQNTPRLPMPNLYNIGEDLERKGAFPILAGAATGAHSVIHLKFRDVVKSLVKFGPVGPIFHSDSTNCIGNFLNGNRPILKQQKSLPPDKANSKLFAEVLALKLNIIASQRGQFPVGLDTLIYDYSSLEPGNPLNGKTVREICTQADSILDCTSDPKGLHLLPVDYYSVIHLINSAFASDAVDTASWSCGKLILKGVRPLKSVPFLFARPGSIHSVTVPFLQEAYRAPEAYALAQNYPNPFNPTTTIQFELPQASVVTLKIYNMLGQEIATLFDEQQMEDGVQEVEFDASGLTSGVYFYRIIAQGNSDPEEGVVGKRFVEVKKMLLLK
jgi:hypothetical protein